MRTTWKRRFTVCFDQFLCYFGLVGLVVCGFNVCCGVLDFLRTIRDPEKPSTLEDLKVVYEEGIFVKEPTADNVPVLRVEYNPTVPHCSLATLIGLCIRIKIQRSIHHPIKLDIYIKKGAHTTEDESE